MGRPILWVAAALVIFLGVVLALRQEGPSTPADRLVEINLPDDRPLRIVVMGSSLTANYEWPSVLEQGLACLPIGASIVTVAKAGAGIRWGGEQVDSVAEHDPDLVFIEFAINDADLIDGVSLTDAERLHDELISDLQALETPPEITLMTMSPAKGPRGWVRYWLADHYAQYRKIAEEQEIGLLDLYPRWLERSDRGLAADGLHPDPQIAAEVIIPAMVDYFARTLSVSCTTTDRRTGG